VPVVSAVGAMVWHPAAAAAMTASSEAEARKRAERNWFGRIVFAAMGAVWTAAMAKTRRCRMIGQQ
jgi:hypothetical protein